MCFFFFNFWLYVIWYLSREWTETWCAILCTKKEESPLLHHIKRDTPNWYSVNVWWIFHAVDYYFPYSLGYNLMKLRYNLNMWKSQLWYCAKYEEIIFSHCIYFNCLFFSWNSLITENDHITSMNDHFYITLDTFFCQNFCLRWFSRFQ